jgi:uncharacterized membrane protein
MMEFLKKAGLIILVIGYLAAPEGYINIIPQYIPLPKLMNIAAGFFEILFGLMLIFKRTRPWAARGIILMLIAFIPVHIDMVLNAPFWLGSFYVTPFIAWARLVVLQPFLIWWVWWCAKE